MGQDAGENQKGKKRRRTGGTEDLTPDDAMILRDMSKFSSGSMPFCESLAEFVRMVGESPDHAVGCRLKKASLKKAMQDIQLSLMKFQNFIDFIVFFVYGGIGLKFCTWFAVCVLRYSGRKCQQTRQHGDQCRAQSFDG